MRLRLQHVDISDVDDDVEPADQDHSDDQRTWDVSLRILHLPGHHRQVVPAVVGPKRLDQGDTEKRESPRLEVADRVLPEVRPVASAHAETKRDQEQNPSHFARGEDGLYPAANSYPTRVCRGQEEDHRNRYRLDASDPENQLAPE